MATRKESRWDVTPERLSRDRKASRAAVGDLLLVMTAVGVLALTVWLFVIY